MLQQHLEAQHWIFEWELNSQIHLQPHISWNTHFQWSFHQVKLSDISEVLWDSTEVIASHYEHYLCYHYIYLQSEPQAIDYDLLFALVTPCPQPDSFIFGCSIFPCLKSLWNLFSPSTPKLISYMLHCSPLCPWESVWNGEISRWWHHFSWFHCKMVDGAYLN